MSLGPDAKQHVIYSFAMLCAPSQVVDDVTKVAYLLQNCLGCVASIPNALLIFGYFIQYKIVERSV